MLSSQVKSSIAVESLKTPKEEVCGFVLLKNNQYFIYPCKNIALNKNHHFVISGEDYLKASLQGDLISVYHSHCFDNEDFSEVDKINSNGFNLPLIQYHVNSDRFFIFNPDGSENKYIGREFKIGENDCFSLIRDYYYNELGITITNYYRGENWMTNSQYYFDTQYSQEGFIKVDTTIRKNDIILIKHAFAKDFQHATHAAIYLGNEKILHHIRDGFSRIDDYSEPYKRRTMMILRHKTQC